MQADQTLEMLSAHAQGTMADFISIDAKGEAFIDLQKATDAGKLGLIRRIGKRFGEWEIELYDAQAALVTLARYHGLFTDKIENREVQKIIIEYVNDWRGV